MQGLWDVLDDLKQGESRGFAETIERNVQRFSEEVKQEISIPLLESSFAQYFHCVHYSDFESSLESAIDGKLLSMFSAEVFFNT